MVRMMIEKTGDDHLDELIAQNADLIRELEDFAKKKAEENDRLIKRVREIRAKRLNLENE